MLDEFTVILVFQKRNLGCGHFDSKLICDAVVMICILQITSQKLNAKTFDYDSNILTSNTSSANMIGVKSNTVKLLIGAVLYSKKYFHYFFKT